MCMVESHSDDNLIETLNKKYNHRTPFIHTHDKENPKTKGITVLMNTPLTNSLPSNIQIIVPGHAIQFSIQWPHQSTLTILAVYTLNPPNENCDFWKHLTSWYNNPNTTKLHIMLSNMNTIKDQSDCLRLSTTSQLQLQDALTYDIDTPTVDD